MAVGDGCIHKCDKCKCENRKAFEVNWGQNGYYNDTQVRQQTTIAPQNSINKESTAPPSLTGFSEQEQSQPTVKMVQSGEWEFTIKELLEEVKKLRQEVAKISSQLEKRNNTNSKTVFND